MTGPLDGVPVLDFTRYQQGPYATALPAREHSGEGQLVQVSLLGSMTALAPARRCAAYWIVEGMTSVAHGRTTDE